MAAPSEDIGRALADAGRALQDTASSVASSSSEPREQGEQGRRVLDELERRSDVTTSSARRRRSLRMARQPDPDDDGSESVMSLGTTNSMQAVYRSGVGAPTAAGSQGTLPADTTVILDKVELAIADAKRAALEKAKEVPATSAQSATGGSSSVSNTESSSVSGSNPSSKIASGAVGAGVVPAIVAQSLQPEKKQAIDKVVTAVVEKTGAELAQMQVALEKAKEKAMMEAKQKAELEARLATIKTNVVAKDVLAEALSNTRGAKIAAEEERDDLKDQLAGMQTLIDTKLERHRRENEELRKKTLDLEEKLRAQTDGDKEVLKEQLAIAAKEMELAKKQKIAVASERDVLAKAELAAKKAHEAEIQAIKAEMVAAKVELKRHGIDSAAVLPIMEGEDAVQMEELEDDDSKTAAEKMLALKLREQRDKNKRLHQDFERLRLEILNTHEEKDAELAELKAKVEVESALPAKALLGRATKRHTKQPPGRQQNKLSLHAIDEEEEDVASQAGSGVSGQVSSDCDGVGVGDLRDFDDWEDSASKVRSLKEKLIQSESLYKHLDEVKKGKEAEYMAKIQRLAQQLQQARQDAINSKDWANQLQIDKKEIEAQKQAEVENVKAHLLEQQLDIGLLKVDDTQKVMELEEKLKKYTTQVMELREQLSSATEMKRTLNLRLQDMRRELQATEERHTREMEQMASRLREHGVDPEYNGDEEDATTKNWTLEEERNLLRNELEGQQVLWQSQLEVEQRQASAALAKLKEEREVAEKDRELRRKVEDQLQETQRSLKMARQALAEAEGRLQTAAARDAVRSPGGGLLDLLRCPLRDRALPAAQHAAQTQGASCQAVVWQILSSVNGVAALLCSDEGFQIKDASKKAFAMWGSATLRGSSLFKLIYDEQMSTWLQTELEAPPAPGFSPTSSVSVSSGFWLKDLGFVEFRSRLGSAFDASVICARLPAEPSMGQPASIAVVVQPASDESQQQVCAVHGYAHGGAAGGHMEPQLRTGRMRRGPASVTSASSVHSEDITANDSVSNVNARW